MDLFEQLLEADKQSVERFVRFRISARADADDVLQEIYLTACQKFSQFLRTDGDVRNYITFLDSDEFLPNWDFGEDNCGNEIHLAPKGGYSENK